MPHPYFMERIGEYPDSRRAEAAAERWQARYDEAVASVESDLENALEEAKALSPWRGLSVTEDAVDEIRVYAKKLAASLDHLLQVCAE